MEKDREGGRERTRVFTHVGHYTAPIKAQVQVLSLPFFEMTSAQLKSPTHLDDG